jgi:hypothetical protein
MAETLESIRILWLEYYPIIVTGVVAFFTFIAGAYVIYKQAIVIIQPILDKIQAFRDKDDEKAVETSILDKIKIDILKADLLAKIDSTAISPELTMIYQDKLDQLTALTTTVVDKADSVEEDVNKYIG